MKKKLILELETSIFTEDKKFSWGGLFLFLDLLFLFRLKYEKKMRLESSFSGNIRNFLIIELEISILGNTRYFFGVDFLNFMEPGLKSTLGSSIIYYHVLPHKFSTDLIYNILEN